MAGIQGGREQIGVNIIKFSDKIIFTIRKPGGQEKNTPSEMHYSLLLGSWIPYRKHMEFYEFNFVHLLSVTFSLITILFSLINLLTT